MVLLLRSRLRPFRAALWLDGLLSGLTLVAVAAALVVGAVVESSGGDLRTLVFALVYPVADGALICLAVVAFALTGWRPGRMWTLLGASLVVIAVADSIYTYQAALGTYESGTMLGVLWPVSAYLVAVAAWQPAGRRPEVDGGLRLVLLPGASALVAIAVLVAGQVTPPPDYAVGLATAALLVGVLRAGLSYKESAVLLRRADEHAHTDGLTGLGNRRRLMADLDDLVLDAGEGTLVFFDLNGFKNYNDAFGHGAGDALLAPGHLAGRRGGGSGPGVPPRRRRVLRAPRARRRRRRARRAARGGGARRARRRVRGHDLLRAGRHAGRGGHGERCPAAGRRAHVRRQGGARLGAAPGPRRDPADPARERARPARAPRRRHGARRPGGPAAGAAGRRAGGARARRGAPRRRQGGAAGGAAARARPADGRGVGLRAPAHDRRRADPQRGAHAAPGRAAGALQPRALGRQGLPRRPRRRRHPPRGAGDRRLRLLQRHGRGPPPPPGRHRRGGAGRAAPLLGHPVRPARGHRLRPRGRRPTAAAAAEHGARLPV